MKKVSVIGHFAFHCNFSDGQTVKTKIVTAELKRQFGEDQVDVLDTVGGKKALIRCFFKTFSALKNSKNVIMFPAHNGVRFFTPVLLFWNMFFHRKLHYCVIGGWLPQFLQKRQALAKKLKKFDGIYVETNTMKKALEAQGFTNVFVVPNCKKLSVLSENELVYPTKPPFKLCTFSRVNRLKGIEDAAKVIQRINEEKGTIFFELDIYGRVDEGEEEWFKSFADGAPSYIRYCGCVDADKSVEVLKHYFALLFPTKYFTEGIPGTVIDAYAAGIPVISAKWESFSDVVDDGITGIGYEFDNVEELQKRLLHLAKNPEEVLHLKQNCLKKAEQFTPEPSVQKIIEKINTFDR